VGNRFVSIAAPETSLPPPAETGPLTMKMLRVARLQFLTQHTRPNVRLVFCRTRSRSRPWTRAASVPRGSVLARSCRRSLPHNWPLVNVTSTL
jgi:hypothetical protein